MPTTVKADSTKSNYWNGPAPVLSYGHRRLSRLMRLEEGMNLAHRQGNPLFGLFPGEDAHFGFRSEHRALDGDGVRVRGDIVGQDQDRVLATTHEIACHGEDEVGIGFEHS